MISPSALRDLRVLLKSLPSEDGRHFVNDMVIWASDHGEALLAELDASRAPPAPPEPGLYEHYKGGVYRLLVVYRDEATKEHVAVYLCVSDRSRYIWSRPASEWSEEVSTPSGRRPRFLRVDE